MGKIPDIKPLKQSGWFYTDEVKDHFFNPRNIFRTQEEIDSFNADGVGLVGSPACGDMMKIWIKVKDDKIIDCKWQTFGSLVKGERIMLPNYTSEMVDKITINSIIINEEGNPVIVEENFVKDYSGKILTFVLSTSNFYQFSVTPNHPLPCFERTAVSKPVRKNGHRWSEVNDEKLQKCKPVVKSASQLKSGDFLIFKVDKRIKDLKELDEDFCKVLGYYVSDGNLPSANRAIFYFGLNETEYIKELESLAVKNKWNCKIFKRNTENVMCFQLNESKIVKNLRVHGGAPSNKSFSSEVMLLPAKKQSCIVDKYVNGDGWILQQNDNWESQHFISTSKENLAYQLQMMLARNKIFAPIHKREPRKFNRRGKTYSNNGEYNLVFRKNTQYSRIKYHKKENSFLIPIQKIVSSDYNGKIYDVGLSEEPKVYKIKGISIHNCASAIATTSMLSVMVTENGGMKLDDALKITAKDIVSRLNDLPKRKFHCSVLGHKALRAAINDYFRKSGQEERIVVEGARVIDKIMKVTDKDIENAVIDGAKTFEDVQKKTKVGIKDKSCIPEVEELICFYRNKYFGDDKRKLKEYAKEGVK